MVVDTRYLGELSALLQYTELFESNLTTTDILKNEWQVLEFALSSDSPEIQYFKQLYNHTFGQVPASELPRLIDSVDHGVNNAMVIQWALSTPVLLLVVGLRIWSRHVIMKKVLLSDWLIVIATISTLLYMVELLMAQVYGGAGKHVWDTRLEEIKLNYLFSFIAQCYYFFNATLIKFSLLAFYWSISREKMYRLAIKVLGVFIVIMTILFTFLTIFACKPIAWWINPLEVETKCMHRLPLFEAQGIISAVTDVAILILPSLVVMKLQMSLNQKIMVIVLFLLGLVAPISGFYRLVTLMEYSRGTDMTYLEIAPGQWTILEAQIGIVCASVPALKGLVLFFKNKSNPNKGSEGSSSRTRIMQANDNPFARSKSPIIVTTTITSDADMYDNDKAKTLIVPPQSAMLPKRSFQQDRSMKHYDIEELNDRDSEMVTVGFHADDIEMQRTPNSACGHSFRDSTATAVSLGSRVRDSDVPPPVPPKDKF